MACFETGLVSVLDSGALYGDTLEPGMYTRPTVNGFTVNTVALYYCTDGMWLLQIPGKLYIGSVRCIYVVWSFSLVSSGSGFVDLTRYKIQRKRNDYNAIDVSYD